MSSWGGLDRLCHAGPWADRRLYLNIWVLLSLGLAACSGPGVNGGPAGTYEIGAVAPRHYYPPPGPPEDPWGPYIREASGRFSVPDQWVRAVMQQESGGEEQAVSPVGAMGLMQVMPETYEGLRERYALGNDPFEPHDNILAGTGYIREMYDRFGSPGFLAAYNAGPERVEDYLAGGSRHLPKETVHYLAAITPNLGNAVPMSGPFARYASAGSGRRSRYAPSVASLAAGCDLNAAYDPNHPCSSLERAARTPAPVQTAMVETPVVPQTGVGGCDLDAAYDPNHPCDARGPVAATAPLPAGFAPTPPTFTPTPPGFTPTPPFQQFAAANCDPDAAYDPDHPCTPTSPPDETRIQLASAEPEPLPPTVRPAASPHHVALYHPLQLPPSRHSGAARDLRSRAPAPPAGGWAIQVGAFANPNLARTMAESARAQAPSQLHYAALSLPPTAAPGRSVLYRARLAHLSASEAANACKHLNKRQLPCLIVRP